MPFAIALAQRAQVLSSRPPDLPPFPPSPPASPAVRAAVGAALDRGETHYTDRPGILPLREKVAALLAGRFGLKTDAKADLVVTCGVTEARFVAIQQLLNPGDSLAAPSASARVFGPALLRGATVNDTLTAESKVVHLTSSTPEAVLREQIQAASADARLIYEVDEAESKFHPAQIAGCAERTFTIGDLGLGSWRIGYLASPASFSAGVRDFKQALTICTTNLSQWAALAAMEAP